MSYISLGTFCDALLILMRRLVGPQNSPCRPKRAMVLHKPHFVFDTRLISCLNFGNSIYLCIYNLYTPLLNKDLKGYSQPVHFRKHIMWHVLECVRSKSHDWGLLSDKIRKGLGVKGFNTFLNTLGIVKTTSSYAWKFSGGLKHFLCRGVWSFCGSRS